MILHGRAGCGKNLPCLLHNQSYQFHIHASIDYPGLELHSSSTLCTD